ncbi:MAG: signal peptide peptidase SppA [Alphaproteobacteria bacterium]|nr:signal peptide peptidase SppA [Alphaproteobacteria bacterium]
MNKHNWRRHRPLFAQSAAKNPPVSHRRWRVLSFLWSGTKRLATVLGFVIIINVILMIFAFSFLSPGSAGRQSLPHEMVLFLGFEDGFQEQTGGGGLMEAFAPPEPNVRQLIDALDKAADDARVKGVLARMNGGSFDLAHVYEVRAAIKRFRATGKFAHIYSTSYGEGGGGLGRYYLASAFDEIWMQPLGVVSITGVSAEIPFGRGLLDKIGVKPEFFQRKEYKSAYESLTNKTISPYNKEEMTRIVKDIRAEILASIPADRGMTPAQFEALVHKGLLTASEAEKAGLITRADYGDVLLENIAETLSGKRDADAVNLVSLPDYIAGSGHKRPAGSKPKVALVYALGAIMPTAEGGGFGGGHIAAADEIAPLLYDIAKEKDIQAVVLRIDSPGGSPTASESILRAVEKVQEAGKPVIVSMGPVAASGGYWIAAYADRIFALPTTLTGSIGVVGGKFVIEGLSEKLGVNWETVSWGENSGLWSLNTPFSPGEAGRMNAMMDQIYDSFIARVAKGRKMTPQAVDAVAGGRVWSGRRAVEAGLVDEIGGLNEALDYAATLTGGKDRHDLSIIALPKEKTPLEKVLKLMGAQVALGGQGVQIPPALRKRLEPLAQMIAVQENPQLYSTYEFMRIE